MTKKHFIELADYIRRHNESCRTEGGTPFTEDQIESLAMFCSSQNHLFKWDRWVDYIHGRCGTGGGKL